MLYWQTAPLVCFLNTDWAVSRPTMCPGLGAVGHMLLPLPQRSWWLHGSWPSIPWVLLDCWRRHPARGLPAWRHLGPGRRHMVYCPSHQDAQLEKNTEKTKTEKKNERGHKTILTILQSIRLKKKSWEREVQCEEWQTWRNSATNAGTWGMVHTLWTAGSSRV